MLKLANVKPLILVGLATVNEHRIIIFLILKRARMRRRIAEQGKRVLLHPEGSTYACMWMDGRWALPLDFVASTDASRQL